MAASEGRSLTFELVSVGWSAISSNGRALELGVVVHLLLGRREGASDDDRWTRGRAEHFATIDDRARRTTEARGATRATAREDRSLRALRRAGRQCARASIRRRHSGG